MKRWVASFLLCMGAALAADPNNPTGSNGLIMIDKRGGYVRFFDPVTLKEVASIKTEAPPHELAISPDHKTAYVPFYGDGVYGNNPKPDHRIAIIDLATKQITGTINTSPAIAPHGLQVDASGMLYASCDLSRALLVIDPREKKVRASINTEGTGHWAAVTPDGTKAYVANKDDRKFVSVIDLKARKMTGYIQMPKGTQGITMSPDGKQVIAIDFIDPKFYVIDTATDKIVDTVTVDQNTIGPFRARFSQDGSKLITVNSTNSLANIFDMKNLHAPQTTLKVGQQAFGIAYSPDGNTVLVSNHGDGTISVIDLAERKVVQTFTAGTGIETLSYY